MNRFRLRLFSPVDDDSPASAPDGQESDSREPRDILPFEGRSRTVIFSGRFQAPVDRARMIRQNSVCPECRHHDIEPLELDDAVISPRNRLPVPGTASIVGFHCNHCGVEWPVYELARRTV